jgi:hypothetical protein
VPPSLCIARRSNGSAQPFRAETSRDPSAGFFTYRDKSSTGRSFLPANDHTSQAPLDVAFAQQWNCHDDRRGDHDRHLSRWARRPACRVTGDVDLRTLDRHRDAAVTSLIPALSCRSCQSHAPFAELVKLSKMSIADDLHAKRALRLPGKVIAVLF